ncbi:MAG: hypothetical protein WD072_01410, partial [Pirellulales bacterium]
PPAEAIRGCKGGCGVRTRAMDFEIVSEVVNVETIAINLSIRERIDLSARSGGRRWRKRKSEAVIRGWNVILRRVELHWYEAHGVGKRKIKIKRFVEYCHGRRSSLAVCRVRQR